MANVIDYRDYQRYEGCGDHEDFLTSVYLYRMGPFWLCDDCIADYKNSKEPFKLAKEWADEEESRRRWD